MKIYTKGGDKGSTSLLAGGRVAKHHPRVEAYGTFDEVNSVLGVARTASGDAELEAKLRQLQNRMHVLCGDIAADPAIELPENAMRIPRIDEQDVLELERQIDSMTDELDPLAHFILPGGSSAGAQLHLARTVCRRGERRLTELVEAGGEVSEAAQSFVNRLSDYLFTLARWANDRAGTTELPWIGSEQD